MFPMKLIAVCLILVAYLVSNYPLQCLMYCFGIGSMYMYYEGGGLYNIWVNNRIRILLRQTIGNIQLAPMRPPNNDD